MSLQLVSSAMLAVVASRDGYRALRYSYVRLSRVGDKRLYRREAPLRFWLVAVTDAALVGLSLAGIADALWRLGFPAAGTH